MLKIADNLSLPVEAVTQTIAIIAKRRADKSYTARRFAEELFRANQQIVIVDPKGDWWGIRSSADGKGQGLPVIILGGEHGDLPLEEIETSHIVNIIQHLIVAPKGWYSEHKREELIGIFHNEAERRGMTIEDLEKSTAEFTDPADGKRKRFSFELNRYIEVLPK